MESTKTTLTNQPNTSVRNDLSEPVVADAIRLMTDNFSTKNQRDSRNQVIQDIVENNFVLKSPNGAMRISTKKIVQAQWRLLTKMKPLDFTMHGLQASPLEEKLATAAMSTILKKGGYDATFREKNGMAMNLVNYGDAFRFIGPKKEGAYPVEFTMIDNSAVYVDAKATQVRGGSRPCSKMAIVFSASWDKFVQMFPSAKNIAGPGRLPRDNPYYKDTTQSYIQTMRNDEGFLTEWCYYYDLEHKAYCMFAGSGCTIIEEKIGKDYPYVMEEDGDELAYIPVSHYMGMPASGGFYNHGVLEFIYDLCVLYRRIFNLMSQSVEENVSPLALVNLPNDEADNFFNKLHVAYQERAMGRAAFIPIKQDGLSNQTATIQPFAIQALINEAEVLFNRIDLELKRIGIYLDEIDTVNPTATEVLANIDKQNEFVRQLMEFNASEVEFELKVALDLAKKTIKTGDKVPLNLTTMVNIDGQMVRPDDLTLGVAKKAFKERNWFFVVNSRTGVIPSGTMLRAQLQSVMPLLPQGSGASQEAIRKFANINDMDMDLSDENLAQPVPEEGLAAGGQMPAENNIQKTEKALAGEPIDFKSLA